MSQIDIEIRGLKETQKRMEKIVSELRGEPFLNGMRKATLAVQRDAKIFSPVDTGRLRASITPEIRAHGNTVQGVVGSNVKYAPYQELGTKHMKGRRFLQRAFEKNKERIIGFIGSAVAKIVRGNG